ncbi:IS1 family transposase [uncultured Thiothrix sp.]|uniref:IS1 family transposase n=1 Tax=uncultured Thiothrix sp. TaxID=223185 RepID=UPI003457CCE7
MDLSHGLRFRLNYSTKHYTQSIGRQNLNYCIHFKWLARCTICFSKPIEIHDNVIREYVARNYFIGLNTWLINL